MSTQILGLELRFWTLPKMALGKWDNIAVDLKEIEWTRLN
jgi:hypothetical protein